MARAERTCVVSSTRAATCRSAAAKTLPISEARAGKDACRFADAVGEALVGFLEVEDDLAGLGAERRGAVGDAVGEALVGLVEDAAELAGAGFELLGAVRDAGDELFVGPVEDAAEFGSAGGERIGGFADAHAEPLVGIVEVAQDVAGARGERARRFHGAGDQLLVGLVEDAGDVAGACRHGVRPPLRRAAMQRARRGFVCTRGESCRPPRSKALGDVLARASRASTSARRARRSGGRPR